MESRGKFRTHLVAKASLKPAKWSTQAKASPLIIIHNIISSLQISLIKIRSRTAQNQANSESRAPKQTKNGLAVLSLIKLCPKHNFLLNNPHLAQPILSTKAEMRTQIMLPQWWNLTLDDTMKHMEAHRLSISIWISEIHTMVEWRRRNQLSELIEMTSPVKWVGWCSRKKSLIWLGNLLICQMISQKWERQKFHR